MTSKHAWNFAARSTKRTAKPIFTSRRSNWRSLSAKVRLSWKICSTTIRRLGESAMDSSTRTQLTSCPKSSRAWRKICLKYLQRPPTASLRTHPLMNCFLSENLNKLTYTSLVVLNQNHLNYWTRLLFHSLTHFWIFQILHTSTES